MDFPLWEREEYALGLKCLVDCQAEFTGHRIGRARVGFIDPVKDTEDERVSLKILKKNLHTSIFENFSVGGNDVLNNTDGLLQRCTMSDSNTKILPGMAIAQCPIYNRILQDHAIWNKNFHTVDPAE
jgi:hypothetical protein